MRFHWEQFGSYSLALFTKNETYPWPLLEIRTRNGHIKKWNNSAGSLSVLSQCINRIKYSSKLSNNKCQLTVDIIFTGLLI